MTYDQIFIQHGDNRWRLKDIVDIRLANKSLDGRIDKLTAGVEFKMFGDTYQDYVFIAWNDGGQMLWDMISETTAILRAYTPEELAELEVKR